MVSGTGMVAIGVDVSTGRIAFGDSTGKHAVMMVATKAQIPEEAARLQDLYIRVGITARQFVNARAAVVYVEQPAGKVVPLVLIRAVGVVMAGIAHELPGCEVRPVPVSTWKLNAIGHGHATKTMILRWARSRGYDGACPKCDPVEDPGSIKCPRASESHDVADALGIAAAGFVLAGLGEMAA